MLHLRRLYPHIAYTSVGVTCVYKATDHNHTIGYIRSDDDLSDQGKLIVLRQLSSN